MNPADQSRNAQLPKLSKAAQQVAETVASWDGVSAMGRISPWRVGHEHDIDGIGFYVGQKELGHIHLDSSAHVMLLSPALNLIVEAGFAHRSEWTADQVVIVIEDFATANWATWLLELSYCQGPKTSARDVAAAIDLYSERNPK
ncbi:luciferase family protein [Caballeronia sordidicola]|uniref:luciferase family protein n=1 Tax=Caballeronia sordidicola TaxID=196367 RepID=UPI00094C25C3|nr:luciferase family protein [Caballeronia sordidicola]